MFDGLYETHVNVVDLDRSMAFYGETLELTLGSLDESRRIAFYFIGGWNHTMLGVWEKPVDEVRHQHLAFEVSREQLEPTAERLRSKGVVLRDFMGQETQRPTIFGWMPAAAYYFSDPDGHLLEFLARLPGDPNPEKLIIPWDEWAAENPDVLQSDAPD